MTHNDFSIHRNTDGEIVAGYPDMIPLSLTDDDGVMVTISQSFCAHHFENPETTAKTKAEFLIAATANFDKVAAAIRLLP